MLNFMRKDQQQTPLLILRAWVKYSAIIPVAMPLLFALLLGGFAALMGVSPLELALNFLADAGIVLSPVVVQLWFAAYLMVVICYGVGRELINLTTRQPLSLSLATFYARLRQWTARGMLPVFTGSGPTLPAGLTVSPGEFSQPGPTGLLSPALLTGSAPRLE